MRDEVQVYCRDCRYVQQDEEFEWFCHKHAPSNDCFWPKVHPYWWCGDFKTKYGILSGLPDLDFVSLVQVRGCWCKTMDIKTGDVCMEPVFMVVCNDPDGGIAMRWCTIDSEGEMGPLLEETDELKSEIVNDAGAPVGSFYAQPRQGE